MKTNPFQKSRHGGQAIDVESRIDMVRGFDKAQCQAALALDDLQKTVATAIRRRLKLLKKEATK